jgi:Outer membrane protein beta-barrel domain
MNAMKRKQLIVWILCWFIGPFVCSGQSTSAFRLGLIGGVNAGLIKNQAGYQSILWRYNAGITVEQRFSPAIGLIYQLIYSKQGETVNSRGYNAYTGKTTDKQVIGFDYMALPVMLRVRPKGERAFLEAGGQIGYLIHKSFYLASQPNQVIPIQHTQPIDVGLTGGIGYRLGKHVVVDGRYYYGMKPLRENYTAPDPQTGISTYYRVEKWYNRVWSLNLSYYF